MPSWKDNLTGPEIDALHKYKTQGKESLSGDEIELVHKYRQYLKLSNLSPGMAGLEAIEPSIKPVEKPEPSLLHKIAAPIEAGVSILTSPIAGIGNIVGAVGELAGAGKGEDIAANINKYIHPQPTTELGKEYVEKVGKVLDPLNAVLPNLSMMRAASLPISGKLEAPVARPKPVNENFAARDKLYEVEKPVEQKAAPTKQTELDLGQPNQFGVRPSEMVLDENGIPIRRNLSEEAQLTERGGQDLFAPENIQRETIARNIAEWEEPSIPSRDYLKAQEIEQAYLEKSKQEALPIEEPVTQPSQASPIVDKMLGGINNRASRYQRGAVINPIEALGDLKNASRETIEKLYSIASDALASRKLSDTEWNELWEQSSKLNQELIRRDRLQKRQQNLGKVDPDALIFQKGDRIRTNANEVRGLPEGVYTVEEVKWIRTDEGLKPIPKIMVDGRLKSLFDSDISQKFTGPSTLGGVGKRGFKQGGAIAFDFSKDKKAPSFDSFLAEERARGVTAEDAAVKRVYEKLYPSKTVDAQKTKALSNIVGEDLNKYESRPVEADPLGEQSVARMAEVGSADMPTIPGGFFKNFAAGGRLQGWMSKSPVAYEGIGFITSVKDHYRIQSAESVSQFNQVLRKYDLHVPGLKGENWKTAQGVFDIWRKNEFNPEFKPEQVFTRDQLELFNAMRQTYEQLGGKIQERLSQINPEIKFDPKKIPYYFTSYFMGDFSVPIFNKQTGQLVFNLRETSRHNAELAKDWINANHPDWRANNVKLYEQSNKANKQLDSARVMSDFEMMLDMLGREDPQTMSALNALTGRQQGSALRTSDMPSRFERKEGFLGSMGNKPWLSERQNYLDNKKAFEMYVEGANEWLGNTQITQFLERMNKDKAITADNAKSLVNDYANYVIGMKDIGNNLAKELQTWAEHSVGLSRGAFTRGTRAYSNVVTSQLVGWWSPRALIQNVMQPLQATSPMLLKLSNEGYKGNYALAVTKGIYEGIHDVISHWGDSEFVSTSRGFKEDNHVIDAHLVEQSKQVFGSSHAGFAYDVMANKSVTMSEQVARSVAFSIYHNFLESAGIPRERALDMAKNITHETMVNYESYAKPQVFGRTGALGEMAGRLQTYKFNDVTQLVGYIKDMEASSPKTWAPFATKMGMSVAMAGVMGLIGIAEMQLIWNVIQAMNERTEEPNEYIRSHSIKDIIYESMPTIASKGILTATTGYDLSGAFAQNLVGENPLQNIVPIVGKLGEQLQAPFNLMSKSDIDVGRGAIALAPTTMQALIEKAFLSDTSGGTTRVFSPQTGEVVYKGKDTGMKLNLRTEERARQAMERKSLRDLSMFSNERAKEISKQTNNLVVDYFKADTQEEQKAAADAIKETFIKYEKSGHDPQQLVQQIQAKLTRIGVGDDVIQQLMTDITMNNRNVWKRAAELKQMRK